MKNPHRTLRIFFSLAFFLIARNAGAQPLNNVIAGTTGTPVTFNMEFVCIHGDPQYTLYWDFGPGATPAKATTIGSTMAGIVVNFAPQQVTYSTPGRKTFALTIDSAGSSSVTNTFALHIFDCSSPAIPHDAIVINSDTIVTPAPFVPSKTYWVNPGVALKVYGSYDSTLTIFAEPGSKISYASQYGVLYMKHGSVLAPTNGDNCVIFGDGANVSAGSTDFTLNCPALDFDYTNAPPNAAFPLSVAKNELSSVSLTLSPNPTSGMLHVQGLPSNNITVSVFNVLGEAALVQKRPTGSDFALDLSSLVPGTYYVRFASANSVVTKMVVRE